MNINYIQQGSDIDADFSATIYSMYMDAQWGIQTDTKSPLWYTSLRKQLYDYQLLCSVDCNNEYFLLSQGHTAYDCCPTGYTSTARSSQVNCCTKGSSYDIATGRCVDLAGVVSDTVECPCCPPGYTYISFTGVCQGVKASEVSAPIPCVTQCISDTTGDPTGFITCPQLVPDTILLAAPGYGNNPGACCETLVTEWTGCC